MTLSQLTFVTAKNFGHTFRMPWVLLMAVTSPVHLLLQTEGSFAIIKVSSPKTASFPVPLHSSLCTVCVVMRAPQVMQESGMTPACETLKFLMESTTLVMRDTLYAKKFSLHTRVYDIILLSGVVQT
jgi:hypothetical protein